MPNKKVYSYFQTLIITIVHSSVSLLIFSLIELSPSFSDLLLFLGSWKGRCRNLDWLSLKSTHGLSLESWLLTRLWGSLNGWLWTSELRSIRVRIRLERRIVLTPLSIVVIIWLESPTSSKHSATEAHFLTCVLIVESFFERLICEASNYELWDRKCKYQPKHNQVNSVPLKICAVAWPLNCCHDDIHQTREHNDHNLAVVHRCISHVVNPDRN